MAGGGIHPAEVVFLLLLLFVAIFGALARKLQAPYPIVLVVAGLALSFMPGLPRIELDPQVVFFVFLPPLLYSAAWTTSWRDFRYNLVSIVFLAVGLVGFTVAAIAAVAPRLFQGFDARLGFLLGAVIAPTDAIAATSIARRVGLPRRIVDVLEGESLVNDATGLLALQFGLALATSGHAPGAFRAAGQFVYLVAGGIGIGLLLAAAVAWFEYRVDDSAIEITISLLVPYAAYLAADTVGASGVLAVVACGLYLSRQSSAFFSPTVRIEIFAVWRALTFILNGFVFVLIGLQLRTITGAIHGVSVSRLVLHAGVFTAVVIALRLLWVLPGAYVAWLIRTRFLGQKEPPPALRHVFLVGWAGMRGVVSLAAAIGLPIALAGEPFRQRNAIIFFTFVVILVTLVLQGLTLPVLARLLRVAGYAGPACEEKEAREIVTRAALDFLRDARQKDGPQYRDLYADAERHYHHRLHQAQGTAAEAKRHRRSRELSRELLRVERQTAVGLRNEGRISDDVLRDLEHDIDLREARMTDPD